MTEIPEEIKDIIRHIRDNKLDEFDITEALICDDDIWYQYFTIRAIGGANPNFIQNVRDFSLEYAQKEFPEIFIEEEKDDIGSDKLQ